MSKSQIATGGIADDAVTAAKVTGLGKIGQVVTTTFTGTESTTTNLSSADSYTTSSVAATLTPTATSSKIYVACTINAGSSDATNGCHIGRFLMAVSGGSTTTMTLSHEVPVNDVFIFINGVCQIPTSAYSISGTTVTFASALSDGDVVVARYQR